MATGPDGAPGPVDSARRQPAWVIRRSTPIARRFAGRRWFPIWAVVRHRGRKSGREYAVPVAVLVTPGTFVIGLPWGSQTNWAQNVLAAGECGIRWKGREYRVCRPELVEPAVAMARASPVQQLILKRIGIEVFLQVHR